VAWSDLPALVPELVPDAIAARAVKDAEGDELRALRAGLRTASYRVAGRRGRSGIVAWDPVRIADPATALAGLLHEQVMVDHPSPDPDPASASSETEASFMDPETWEPPSGVIEDDGEPPPLWEPPRTPAPSSPYVIAGLFRIGHRLVVDVVRPPAPPPDPQAKAA
jgi:hypothetical protein